jgi:hypothetical protein
MPNPGYFPNARLGLGETDPSAFLFLVLVLVLCIIPYHPTLGCFLFVCLLLFSFPFLPAGLGILNIPPTMPPLHTSPHHREKSHHYIPSHVPIMEGDAGRRYSGAQRHRHAHAENPNGTSTSPRSPHTPYPLPYHHHLLPKSHHPPQPPFLDVPSAIDDPPIRQRQSLPDVVVSPGPRSPSARARFVSLPLPRAEITECDRLERACGRVPAAFLRVPLRDDQPPSSPHQPRRNGAHDAPMAPKWPHWTLVLRIKRVLRRDGKDVRDYVEAAQIDEMFRRDVEERARRESEHARMARVRAGKESADLDENTRLCLLLFFGGVLSDRRVG